MAEYIARISYGKDSLKMLEVIHSRGLPLDRITTTDVWATDTISANLPPMDAFKSRMDQRIWELYHIEVEHLCARNKDGSKKTYEQMFYHVPVRRSPNWTSRETAPSRLDSRIPGHSASVVSSCIEKGSYPPPRTIQGFQFLGRPWCRGELKCHVPTPPRDNQGFSRNRPSQMVPETQDRQGTTDSRLKSLPGAANSKSTRSKHLFR